MPGARVGTAAQTCTCHMYMHVHVPCAPRRRPPLLGLLAHAALPVACRNTKLRKAESMVHYWDARVPFWNGKGSHADIKGQETRAFIADLEAKARKRYDALY